MGALLTKSSGNPRKRKPPADITDEDRAILSLKTQRRKLGAERKRIEELIDKNVEVARQLIAQKRKDKALLALKKKKLQEEQVKKLDAWLLNVEGMLSNIEMARQQNRLFVALKQGSKVMEEIRKEVTVEDVEKLMEDTAEAKEYQDQLQEILGHSMNTELEDEVLEEFKVLELEVLPAAPTKVPEKVQPAGVPMPMIQSEEEVYDEVEQREEPLLA